MSSPLFSVQAGCAVAFAPRNDPALVLKRLAALPKLEEIWLNETKVTSDGLTQLTASKSLKSLWLTKKATTPEALKSLQKALPKLHFHLL